MNPNGVTLGLAFLWAFLVALFAVPSVIYIAHLKNMLDLPNKRTVHAVLTPRLGGVAIFAGFMSALTIFADLRNGIQQLLAGCIVLFFVGLKDDLVSISPAKKLVGQLLATGIVMFMADIRITSFQGILGIHELPDGVSYAFTFLAIAGITNAINLIDGLDGLAGSIVIIIVSTLGYYFFRYGGTDYGNYVYVSICVIGGMLGFLRYNFHKATIFMGDTGSLLCGFIVSVLTIKFIEMGADPQAAHPFGSANPSVAIGILFVPLFDTIRVFTVRILNGTSPFTPDKNHIHHRILAMGFQQIGTVLLLVLLNLVVVLIVINFAEQGNTILIVALLAFSLLLSVFLGTYRSRSAQQRVAS